MPETFYFWLKLEEWNASNKVLEFLYARFHRYTMCSQSSFSSVSLTRTYFFYRISLKLFRTKWCDALCRLRSHTTYTRVLVLGRLTMFKVTAALRLNRKKRKNALRFWKQKFDLADDGSTVMQHSLTYVAILIWFNVLWRLNALHP